MALLQTWPMTQVTPLPQEEQRRSGGKRQMPSRSTLRVGVPAFLGGNNVRTGKDWFHP